MRKFVLIAAAAILSFLPVGQASAAHGTSPNGLEIPIEKAATKFAADIKDGGYKIVTTEELKKWLDEGKKVTIISSLPASDDKEFGTIPAAVNGEIPKTEKELTPADKANLLKVAGPDKEKTIVVYCGFVACRRSHIGAKILVENGFLNVYRYPAGITGWQEMGYPVSK
jgi:thiosulfate/3-mercaptopyruvate sulfurtransferase